MQRQVVLESFGQLFDRGFGVHFGLVVAMVIEGRGKREIEVKRFDSCIFAIEVFGLTTLEIEILGNWVVWFIKL